MDEYDYTSHNINYDYIVTLKSTDFIPNVSSVLLTDRLVDEYRNLITNMRAMLNLLDRRHITSISGRLAYFDEKDAVKWMSITVTR